MTEKIAFGIVRLIKKEEIHLSIDLHEAAPEYPVVNAIVFHENSATLAAIASMELQMEGIEATEGIRYAQAVNDFIQNIKQLGPTPLSKVS